MSIISILFGSKRTPEVSAKKSVTPEDYHMITSGKAAPTIEDIKRLTSDAIQERDKKQKDEVGDLVKSALGCIADGAKYGSTYTIFKWHSDIAQNPYVRLKLQELGYKAEMTKIDLSSGGKTWSEDMLKVSWD